MNKRNTLIIIISLFLLCLPLNIKADYDAIINDSSVRIRKKPTTSGGILYTTSKGTEIKVVDKTLYDGTGSCKKWYKVIYKGKTGYICSKYVTFNDISFTGINVLDWTSRVNANNVTVRKDKTTKSDALDTLSLGVNVDIISTHKTTNTNCSTNTWYKIKYYNNKTGYICSKYVTEKKNITLEDSEYATTLKEAGFPDSYIPYLTYLHSKYPNWTFKAKNTNANFATAVDAEEGLNYMQTKNDNYRTSNKPAEGSTWFKANAGVIAFYMDPRNWLTKERIFMFEKLDYDATYETIYPELVKSLFGDGKLGEDIYVTPMVTNGKNYKVSPLHIGSRIRLEVGKNGSHSTDGKEFTYKGEKFSGYYNFFNIGAYEQTIDGVDYSSITMGLVTAKKNGWDTIDKAIEGGVKFLANGYITKGQGTLYYQKFNVSPDSEPYSTKYLHQYMTNIQAPATEGNQNYNSYKKASILSNPFIFEIPVYYNMPEYTSLPLSGDADNTLKSLSVTNYSIEPTFDSDVLSYEVYIPSEANKITVNASASSSKATLVGTGEYEITDAETDITITVTPEVGESKKYVLTVIKNVNTNVPDNNDNNSQDTTDTDSKPNNSETNVENNKPNNDDTNVQENKPNNDDINIEDNKPNNGDTNIEDNKPNDDKPIYKSISNILSDSSINVSNKTITNVKYNVKSSTLLNKFTKNGAGNVVIKNNSNKEIKDGTLVGTGSTVTITSGNLSETYTFVVKGDTSGDGKITILDLLQIQKHIRGDKKLSKSYLSAADTSGDGKVTILDLLQVQKHIRGDKKL